MNHVFLSGVVEAAPRMISTRNEIAHAVMELVVSHRTASGIEKREHYPISAWRGIAQRMEETIVPGSRVSIKGYLSQRHTSEGTFIEVTVEEFHTTSGYKNNRPVRRVSVNPTTQAQTERVQTSDATIPETAPNII